ncbi:hypothetical protein TWF281_006100 [Arthrobotrys megalospora]
MDNQSLIERYTLDFGNNIGKPKNKKRFLDTRLNDAFTVDLESPWPHTLFQREIEQPGNSKAKAKIDATCDKCGTKGDLVFAGHIEGSILTGLKKFDLSVTPRGIEADFNLEVSFDGAVDFSETGSFKKEFNLKRIPLPSGWTIPGILTFGPNVELGVGLALDRIDGSAKVSTGIIARIPSDSTAAVNFVSKRIGTIHGWLPKFEVKPLKIDAAVSAEVLVHPIITASASLLVLEKEGTSLDISLNLPEIAITASAGYSATGFCPNSPKPFGAKLDVSLGAALSISGWEKLGETKKTLFEKDIFSTKSLYRFPQKCTSFGDEGTCEVKVNPEDQEWWDIEVEFAVISGLSRRNDILLPRARAYTFTCSSVKAPFALKSYPGPALIRARGEAGGQVPIVLPKVGCKARKASECPVKNWNVVLQTDPNVMWAERAPSDGKLQHGWSTEHVYEGNWLPKYWTYVSTKLTCPTVQNLFKVGQAGGYADKMLWSIGNDKTYKTMMTLLPRKENLLKHQMFAKHEFVSGYANIKYNANQLACDIGRIVNTCKYMDLPMTRGKLSNTILALEAILRDLDSKTPVSVGGARYSLAAAHKPWFEGLYNGGIQHTRSRLQEYARKSIQKSDFNSLPSDMKLAIRNIAAGTHWDTYCPSHFVYPTKQPQCGNTDSDVKNCGKCGNKCAANQICKNGKCTTAEPKFPPSITPATSPKSGWTVDFPDSLYVENDISLPQDMYQIYNGKRTVNTRCILVGEVPFAGVKSIPKNSAFTFETMREPSPDTCCVALFDGGICNPYAANVKSKMICEGGSDFVIPFETKAWQVYGCTGLWVGHV